MLTGCLTGRNTSTRHPVKKLKTHLRKDVRRFHQGDMTALLEHHKLCAWNRIGDLAAVIRGNGEIKL